MLDEPFETKGFTNGGYVPKSGQRIVGAGVNVTTLKITDHQHDQAPAAIGIASTSFLEGFEVSDLTIDAALPANDTKRCSASGISVVGRNIFITRVRAIN